MASDPLEWLSRSWKFFHFHNQTTKADRLDIISFYLTDEALKLWDSLNKEEPISTWSEFEKQIHTRFEDPYEDAAGEFTKLRHTRYVKEFLSQLERLSNMLPGVTESFRVGTFISGLREGIRFKAKRDHPQP